MSFFSLLRLIFGIVYVFFIPGFIFSYLFFPKFQIGALKRFIISLLLSMTLVSLFPMVLNQIFRLPINEMTTFIGILSIIFIGIFLNFRNQRLKRAS